MRKINAAVLGCGGMGFTIINNIKPSPYIGEITGYDINTERLKTARERFGVKVTDNIEDIWKDKSIELVYIAAPNYYHVPLAVDALKSGKAVMTEKPMGINHEQIDEILKVQKETGGFLQVGLECRNYSRLYCRIKEFIDRGEIGQLVNVHFTYSNPPFPKDKATIWRVRKDISGSMCLEKLCHYIDLVRWWNGSRVNRYMAVKARNVIPYYEIADNFHVSYSFENGTISHLYFNATASHGGDYKLPEKDTDLFDQDRMGHKLNYVLVGTEGAIEADVFQRELRLFHHAGKPGFQYAEKIVYVENWTKEQDHEYFHNTRAQNLDIARRVAEGLGPAIEPWDAAETMRLCLEFEEAAERGGWEIVAR
jgi:UDP-N-acetyl-2-amino-2-deoxyglucuronate dehydrogenase